MTVDQNDWMINITVDQYDSCFLVPHHYKFSTGLSTVASNSTVYKGWVLRFPRDEDPLPCGDPHVLYFDDFLDARYVVISLEKSSAWQNVSTQSLSMYCRYFICVWKNQFI